MNIIITVSSSIQGMCVWECVCVCVSVFSSEGWDIENYIVLVLRVFISVFALVGSNTWVLFKYYYFYGL